jgi:hypothetical protein
MYSLRKIIKSIIRENSVLEPHAKGEVIDINKNWHNWSSVSDALIDMVKTSYGPLGGWPNIESETGLVNKFNGFTVSDVDDDPQPDVGIYWSRRDGTTKASALVTDGGPEAKNKLRIMMKDFFNIKGHWVEASGAPAKIGLVSLNLPYISDEEVARNLMSFADTDDIVWHGKHPNKEITWGDGWYTRTIAGKRETKIILGKA